MPSRRTSQKGTSKGDGMGRAGSSGEEDVLKAVPSWPASSTSRSSQKRKRQCKNGQNKEKDTRNNEIGETTHLKYALYKLGSAHSELLPEIIQQFGWCDVVVIFGTRWTRVRSQNDSQCARFAHISWSTTAGVTMLFSNKRLNSNNIVRYRVHLRLGQDKMWKQRGSRSRKESTN